MARLLFRPEIKRNYIITKTSTNSRLAEMGLLTGTVFRIIKRKFGMVQIRIKGSDLVLREETFKDIEYDNKG